MSRQRHRVLIVGTGSIGERHLRCFLATERADVSFVETNDAVANAISQRYPAAKRHGDIDAAIAAGIDVAVIATPAPMHVPMATRLARGGVHLLIEKPLAVTLEGVDGLRDAAKERAVTAAVGYVYRAHPQLAEMRETVRSGRLGKPVQVVAAAGQHFPTYRPAYRQSYYGSRASGGGAVQDALTHVINAAEWLVGPIDRLVADLAHQVLDGVEVEDTAHVLARHRGDVLGAYSLNQYQAPNEVTLTAICTGGTARFESHRNRWREMTTPGNAWVDHAGELLERDQVFARQANSFLDAVERRAEPLCGLEEAIATLSTNIAILKSAESGRWESP